MLKSGGLNRFCWVLTSVALLLGLAHLVEGAALHREREFLLHTWVTISAYGPAAPAGEKRAFAAVRRIDRLMNPYEPGSQLAAVNRGAGRRAVEVSGETVAVVRTALRVSRLTGGAYDPTVWPLVRLWGFGSRMGSRPAYRVPTEKEIAATLSRVDYRQVEVKGRSVYLRRTGMGLDLGGVAKGYACDLALAVLRRSGVRSALVDIGGSSICALGGKPGGRMWRVALPGVAGPGGSPQAIVLPSGQALGVSGQGERHFRRGKVVYGHLLDPRTGRPVAGGPKLVCVLGSSAAVADALSTAVFVLGPERGRLVLGEAGFAGFFAPAAKGRGGGG